MNFEASGERRSQVKRVEAGLGRDRLRRRGPEEGLALGIARVVVLLLLLGGQRADERALRVEDLELDLLAFLRRLLEQVLEARAGRRVLADGTASLGPAEAIGGGGREEVGRGGRELGLRLPQRRDVVEDPERAALRRDDDVLVLDHEVGHGNDGQVALQRLPRRAGVEGHVDPRLGAGEQQAAAHGVLAHHAHEGVGGAGPPATERQVAPKSVVTYAYGR